MNPITLLLPLCRVASLALLMCLPLSHAQSRLLKFGASEGPPDSPAPWRASVDHSVSFFQRHARTGTGGFLSNIDQDGVPNDQVIHVLALSRLVYALSYSSGWRPSNLVEARAAARFITAHMIKRDAFGPYFVASTTPAGILPSENQLHIWEQAYGLCGLVELCRCAPDAELLALIRELHAGLVRRFRPGGEGTPFFMDAELNGGAPTGGGYASVVYVATAYLINLHEADPECAGSYEPILRELLPQAEALWDEGAGWVREGPGENAHAVPGHSFQLAWLFLRAADWTFLSADRREHCRVLGLRILDRILAKTAAWNPSHQGFFDRVSWKDGKPLSGRKDWWQHAEALPTLALAYRMTGKQCYLAQLDLTAQFYFDVFFDHTRGGEYFSVDDRDQPVGELNKGSKGKSSYHVAEAARFVIQYLAPEAR